jgi:uncharacterized protein YegL
MPCCLNTIVNTNKHNEITTTIAHMQLVTHYEQIRRDTSATSLANLRCRQVYITGTKF